MKKKQKKWLWIVIISLFICGSCLYYIGYDIKTDSSSIHTHSVIKLLFSFYSAAAMFFFNNNFSSMKDVMKKNSSYALVFWLIHNLAICSTVTTLVFLFHHKIKNYLKIVRAYWVKRYIIWGINEESITFIRNMQKDNPTRNYEIIVALNEETNISLEQLQELNVAYMYTHLDDSAINSKLFLNTPFNKDTYILLLGNDSVENIDIATTIGQKINKKNSKTLIHMIINTQLSDWVDYFSKDINCDIKTFNKADIIARQFLTICPPYKFIEVDVNKAKALSDYTILIIGFGDTGEQLLIKILTQSQYEGTQFKAIIVDKNMNKLKGQFERKYSTLCKNYNLVFEELDIGSEKFNILLKNEILDINTVIICMPQDEYNVKIGLELNRTISHLNTTNHYIEIMIKCTWQNRFIKKIHSDTVTNKNIHFFGALEDVFTSSIIIDENLDKLAEGINNFYNIHNPQYAQNWSSLTPFLKDANRHPAEHIW